MSPARGEGRLEEESQSSGVDVFADSDAAISDQYGFSQSTGENQGWKEGLEREGRVPDEAWCI